MSTTPEKLKSSQKRTSFFKDYGAGPLDEPITLTGHTKVVGSLVVLPNGQLASVSGDHSIMVFDVERQTCVAILAGHTSRVTSLVVLPKRQLASSSYDNSIKVWDVERQTCVATLRGNTSNVNTSLYSRTGSWRVVVGTIPSKSGILNVKSASLL